MRWAMLRKFVSLFARDPNKHSIEQYSPLIDKINALENGFEALSDQALQGKTAEFKTRLSQGESLDDLLPEAFAAIREASKRSLGLRHYDVQLIGGIALHEGSIAEMRTGEGKTLVATLPLYLNALAGDGAHLVTVNDYLARRDARWMAPIYASLGLSVGVLQMSSSGDDTQPAFLVNLASESTQEPEHQLHRVPRREAYLADITYGTNSEFGFDYLRDNMVMSLEERVQRGQPYAIVDEVDNVLIDEARTPLIISGPASEDTEWYGRMAEITKKLGRVHVDVDERNQAIALTEAGEARVESLLGLPLRDPAHPEVLTHEQTRLAGYLEQALRAQFLYRRDKDYLVMDNEVIIIDEFTGRMMPGRRWSNGLHQAVEAKEGVPVQPENVTYATITLQNYFRMYKKLAGMTGTALTEAEEFDKIYKLRVTAIPTNLEYLASRPASGLAEMDDHDQEGVPFSYYTSKDDPTRSPVYWKRRDYPDAIYLTAEAKFRAITTEIMQNYSRGRPVLVGTASVEMSERLSRRLRSDLLSRLAQTLLIRQAWLEKTGREEDGQRILELDPLNLPLEKARLTFIRKSASDLNLPLEPDHPTNLERLVEMLDLQGDEKDRLVSALHNGIPHHVLNARRHTEESQIIAAAGGFGSIIIATNMAGRGVDIKLGGELAEEVLVRVSQVLEKAGYDPSYKMNSKERRAALLKIDPSLYSPYESEVRYYLRHAQDMQRVWNLGGLHVIGSERHEARRIDNQLRGRAARQGDPGSSRFFVSLDDRLLLDYGGQAVQDLAERMQEQVDEALPLRSNTPERLLEQAQTRIEGTNFEIRKHLVDYDDVLNIQRTKIYDQRNRILTKDNLTEDVTGMLRTAVLERSPGQLVNPNASSQVPWQWLAWLEEIQPPLWLKEATVPSFSLRLLMRQMRADLEQQNGHGLEQILLQRLVKIADGALSAEEEYLLDSVQALIDQHLDRLEVRLDERQETAESFLEGLAEVEEGQQLSAEDLLEGLAGILNTQIDPTPTQRLDLQQDPEAFIRQTIDQTEQALVRQEVERLVGAVEHRLGETLDFELDNYLDDWDALEEVILGKVEQGLGQRRQRLLGNLRRDGQTSDPGQEGEILQDLKTAIAGDPYLRDPIVWDAALEKRLIELLLLMSQGTQRKLGRLRAAPQPAQATRLSYFYYVGRLMENMEPTQISEDVTEHFEQAHQSLILAWGMVDPQVYSSASRQEIKAAGKRALSELYRQLLLNVTGELWVEYLTKMEALRVSVILEGYGQRDPLVMYKSQAFKLFQGLLSDMRQGVVARMFGFIPRSLDTPVPLDGQPDASGSRQG
jgi:preprotein translocase subunit SecA